MYGVPRIPPCGSYTTAAVGRRFNQEASAQSICKGGGVAAVYMKGRGKDVTLS